MFFKRKKKDKAAESEATKTETPDVEVTAVDEAESAVVNAEAAPAKSAEQEKPAKTGWFTRIKQGLSRTSSNFAEGLGKLILGHKTIDADLLEEIETQLLVADVGIDATSEIIDDLTERVARKQLADSGALYGALRQSLTDLLKQVESPLEIDNKTQPTVILVVGVNGVGKTTTIGKLAKRFQTQGKSVMLAAGDTFRAAAVEQLEVWGERNQVPVVAQHTGADSASVIFDAIQSAQSKGVDVVIADTAGRLHNKSNLMDELSKVKRVMAKLDVSAPHEVLLVLDAGTGQNAINQAQHFNEAAGVTGIALTKLDGTAKGGIIFALSKKFGIPVRFIGVGEGIEDLQPFDAESFTNALFDEAG
jgi:fused signal recognition particle receptor